MKLYRCKTPTDRLCPCGKVARALNESGIEYEVERVPLSAKPEKRQKIIELTGQPRAPVVVDDEGRATYDAKAIIQLIREGGLSAKGGAAERPSS